MEGYADLPADVLHRIAELLPCSQLAGISEVSYANCCIKSATSALDAAYDCVESVCVYTETH